MEDRHSRPRAVLQAPSPHPSVSPRALSPVQVTALSAMVVLDTFYISYLTYRGGGGGGGGELLGSSLATELVLGGALFFKVCMSGCPVSVHQSS